MESTLPETNMAPENGRLEDEFLLGSGLFAGACAVSFREGKAGFFSWLRTYQPT